MIKYKERYLNYQNIRFVYLFTFIYILSLVSLLTFGYGADDSGYLKYWELTYPLYDYVINGKEMHTSSLEITYLYFFAIFKLFTNNFEYFKFFNTFVSLSVIAYSYYRISKKYYLYMFLYITCYLFIDFNIDQFRNALAASFGLLSIVLLSENKIKYSFIFFIIGVLIHNSMIWLILIYLSKNDNLRKIIIFLLIFVICLPNKFIYLSNILNFFVTFSELSNLHIVAKIISYIDTTLHKHLINNVFSYYILKLFILLYLSYKIKINKIFVDVLLYSFLLYYIFIDIPTIGARIIRDSYLLEPIIVYFVLIKNKQYVLIILPIILYNLFSKNIVLIERMINNG